MNFSTPHFSLFWFATFLLFIVTIVPACEFINARKSVLPVTTRDTTITAANAFTALTLDSLAVEKFATEQNLSDTTRQLFINFYNSRNYQLAWFTEEGPAEHTGTMLNLYSEYLQYSRDTTLGRREFRKRIEEYLAGDSTIIQNPSEISNLELQLTQLFFDYTLAAYEGRTDPQNLQWNIPRKKINVIDLLDSLVSGKPKNISEWEPVNPVYHRLKKEAVRYYEIQNEGGWDTIPQTKKKWTVGDRDSALILVKKRLRAVSDYPAEDTTSLFTNDLESGIVSFQESMGISADGTIGSNTLAELNVPVEKRIEQILINLERMRWLPAQRPGAVLIANIPEFRLHVFSDTGLSLSMRIVVGADATRSVIFTDELKYVVFAPYWNVPKSIVRNEILPSMKKNPNYLQRSSMEITGYSDGLPQIRQKPGVLNALGKVKFIFPNNYNIYFHDTPAKSFFFRDDRALSHGCIRLQDPFALAKFLLGSDSSWTDKKIKSEMNATKEKWVTLKKPLPVFIVYLTAWVNSKGQLNFRRDLYGHDSRMAERLFKND